MTDRPILRIASPCHEKWENMTGDDRARFCRRCQKHVYDLSVLTVAQAADLVREKQGDLCGQFYQRADGTALFADDCPRGAAARQWRRVRQYAGAAASFVLTMLGLSDRAQAGEVKPLMTRGAVCVEPAPSPKPPSTPKPTPSPSPKK